MLRRKTRSERERKKIEDAELTRRLREDGPSALRSPNVILPDPEVVTAVRAYDQALREVARAGSVPEPTGIERAFCEKHPDWQPPRRAWWQPRVSRSECPQCKAEIEAKPVGPPVPVATTNSGLLADVKKPEPRLELAWRRHLEELSDRDTIMPGSSAEEEALSRIDHLREQEKRKDQRGLLKVYSGFPYDDSRVVYTRARKSRRRESDPTRHEERIIVEA